MNFQCNKCLGINAVADSASGKIITCGHCETTLTIPSRFGSSVMIANDFLIQEQAASDTYLCLQISLNLPVILQVFESNEKEAIFGFVENSQHRAAEGEVHSIGCDEGFYYCASRIIAEK